MGLTLHLKQGSYQSSRDQDLIFSKARSGFICQQLSQEGKFSGGQLFAIGSDYLKQLQNATATVTLTSTDQINIKNDLVHNSCPPETISYSTGKLTSHIFYITFSFS